MFYLLNPASGAHTVSVTFGSAVQHGVSAGSVSLSGVAQSAPSAAAINTATSGTAISASIAVATAGSWFMVDAVNSGAGSATFTVGSEPDLALGHRANRVPAAPAPPNRSLAPARRPPAGPPRSSSQLALSVAAFASRLPVAAALRDRAHHHDATGQPDRHHAVSSVTFSVVASGTAPLTVSMEKHWRHRDFSGATSSSLTDRQRAIGERRHLHRDRHQLRRLGDEQCHGHAHRQFRCHRTHDHDATRKPDREDRRQQRDLQRRRFGHSDAYLPVETRRYRYFRRHQLQLH